MTVVDAQNYLTQVRSQYEAYPFPYRRPEEERERLLVSEVDRLGKIDHYCFGGKRDYSQPMRILIAGGGTGDALIYLSEELRDAPCDFVYLDVCAASMETAQERAAIRGLSRIEWIHGSLLDLPRLGLGKFDYINCVGVLHHLAEPEEGLQALGEALADDGGMGLMVYGKYGRHSAYLLQETLGILCHRDDPLSHRLLTARRALSNLMSMGVVRADAATIAALAKPESDAYLVDTYLHDTDHPFTVPEIYGLLDACELHLSGFTNFFEDQGAVCPLEYDPRLFFSDPETVALLDGLSLPEQGHLAEMLGGKTSMHAFYATRHEGARASMADPECAPYFVTSYGEEVAEGIASAKLERIGIHLNSGISSTLPLNEAMRFLLANIDGTTILADLLEGASNQTTAEHDMRWRAELRASLDLLHRLGLVLMRHGDLPPITSRPSTRHWNGAIDLKAF